MLLKHKIDKIVRKNHEKLAGIGKEPG